MSALVLSVLDSEGFCDSLATVFNVTGNRHMSEVAVKKYIVRLSMEERRRLKR